MNISSRKKSMGLSIKGRLILFTLCISLIPIAAITSIYYINSRNDLKLHELNEMMAIAESEKDHVITFLESKKARTIDFSTDGFIRESLMTTIYGRKCKAIKDLNKHLLTNKKTIDPSILEIAVLDTDGKVVASTNEILIGENMSGQELFTQAIGKGGGETFTSKPRYSPEFDANGIFISAPIITSDGSGEVTGVIIIVYDSAILIDITNTISKEVRTVDFGSDGFIRDSLETINRGNFISKNEAAIALNKHLFKNKKPLDPHIMLIEVVDQYGMVVASTDETTIGRDISNQDAFADVLDEIYDKPHIMQPHRSPHLDKSGLDITAPITYKGQVIGIIVNHYDLSVLSEITADHTGQSGSRETLLGMKSGDNIMFLTSLRYVHNPPLGLSIPMDSPEAEPMRLALKGMTGAIIAPDYRGVDVVAAYRHIPMVDWGLVVKVDKEEVFAPLRMLGIIALIVGVFSAAVVVGVSIVFAVSMSRPIRKLTQATERLAGGDLEYEIKIPIKNEIGVLAGSFDTMRIRLGKLLNKIEKDKKEWESTFDSVRDIIILWDKECRLIRCNKALLDNLDVKSEDVIGKNCHEIFPQIKDEDLSKCSAIETTKTLKPVTNEIDVPCLGGIFSISNFPRFDDNGEFVGTVQIMKDITARKRLEDKIQESEKQKKQLLNSLKDGIYQCEPHIEGVFTWVNQAFAEMFGYKSTEEMIGTKVKDIYVDLKDRRRLVEKLEKYGVWKNFASLCKKKNGDCFYTERTSSMVRNEKGEPARIEGIIRDITERRKAEEAVRKMAAIVESSDDAIIGETLEGIITSWNPGAEQIYGYTANEMIGKNISILDPSNRIYVIQGILERISRGESIEHFEAICITKDGNEINVSLTISPVKDRDGKILGVSTIARDITRTRELEEKLKISYKMSSLGRLTAGVFHEILNPLNIISSYAQLLLSQGKWGSKTEGDLKKVLEEVGRIVKITDGLLRFARRKEPKVEEVKINDLLEKVINIVEPEMKLENIKLLKKFDERLPKVMANSDELRQVFLNLLHNADYAMPDGGELTVSTQSIKKQGKLFVRISFTDTGCGIPAEYLDKVFEPFFTNKKEGEGTGLGLSISYGIIDNHGGKLSVESEEGKGTTFTVDLPVKD